MSITLKTVKKLWLTAERLYIQCSARICSHQSFAKILQRCFFLAFTKGLFLLLVHCTVHTSLQRIVYLNIPDRTRSELWCTQRAPPPPPHSPLNWTFLELICQESSPQLETWKNTGSELSFCCQDEKEREMRVNGYFSQDVANQREWREVYHSLGPMYFVFCRPYLPPPPSAPNCHLSTPN
jgi:hypothetical protein